jgi:Ser/Thr protein kinase RdoA (MazF antagonist)
LGAFVTELPARFAQLAEAGLPDTLVHGDFHPGNVRGDGDRLVVLDWGDTGVGHPLFDEPAFLENRKPEDIEPLQQLWARLWRESVPGSDPILAARLIAPIAAARQAVIYRKFLDNIEPSERVYHAPDPAFWLQRAAQRVRDEQSA